MIVKKSLKNRLVRSIFGCFFGILGLILPIFASSNAVYAVPDNTGEETVVETTVEETEEKEEEKKTLTCDDSLGSLGWLVCPTTGKISEAVDWLYAKNKDLLEVNPVVASEESPIYQIWNYCLGVANIAFIIFLLVAVYSQITGVGISNYGVKKVLPKLIVAAILVNLSFLICSLAVDASNIIGNGARGIFTSIEESTVPKMLSVEHYSDVETSVAMTKLYGSLADGTTLSVGAGAVAFEGGEIWMLIPAALGALVAVVAGLITIALRQVVVTLLIMIAPLAIVAYILPNTDGLFRKWKDLLTKMLVFYPMYSLLFGASSLAGWAIIASSSDGFGMILGTVVKILPLFFSWSLMKMSGTFLGTVNARIVGLFNRPLATNKAWAESHRELTRQKFLASSHAYTPSLRLRQFLSDRKIAREEETAEKANTVKNRGLYYGARKNYIGDTDILNAEGEEAYEEQARNAEYQYGVLRHKDNMNKGFADRYKELYDKTDPSKRTGEMTRRLARLQALDEANIEAFDKLKAEQARGEKIEIDNATGYHKRTNEALSAHMYELHGDDIDEETGKSIYKDMFNTNEERMSALKRYNTMSRVMEGNLEDTQFIVGNAAHAYDAQKKVYETKMRQLYDYTVPTKEVERRLSELTESTRALDYIDGAIAGLRVLNQRGDTDLIREQIEKILQDADGNPRVKLGTHASQALASFLMFEVKDNDPFLRRFGKYINLETAQVYNKRNRINDDLTLNEYVTGEYNEIDEDGNPVGIRHSKRDMTVLTEGTSLDNIERTAMKDLDDMLKNAYTTGTGDSKVLDVKSYLAKREQIETAIGPAFISASLKHLSGSEQLKSMVSFLTGYGGNGKARWEDGGDLAGCSDEEKEFAEKYFRRKTLQYFKDQTPTQILGLRSDYMSSVANHLFNDYVADEEDSIWHSNLTDDEKREKAELMANYSSAQSEYNNAVASGADEATKKEYAGKMNAAKEEIIGSELRRILRQTGKLEQIYRTRRSGAANNAKDWLRRWLDLDNEIAITKELEDNKRKRKEEFKEEERRRKEADPNYVPESDEVAGGFDASDRHMFVSDIEQIRDDCRGEDKEVFYDACMEHIKNSEYHNVSSRIVKEFTEYYNNHEFADMHDLCKVLTDMLIDPDYYK